MSFAHFYKTTFLTILAGTALTTSLTVSNAQAAGFFIKEQSGSLLGTAFAGAATGTGDVTSSFFNPASIANLSGHQMSMANSLIFAQAEVDDVTVLQGGLPVVPGTATNGDIGSTALIPVFYGLYDYNDQINFSASVTAPWGLTTDYDGQTLFRYHALTSELKTINFAPSVSYKVNDKLSLGLTAQIQYAGARLTQALNCGAAIGSPFTADCVIDNEGNDIGYGYVIGAQWDDDKYSIGASFRSAVYHDIEGDAKISLPGGITAPQEAALRALFPAKQDVSTKLTTPEMVHIGGRYHVNEKWDVMADVSWTGWSDFREIRLSYETGVGGSPESVTPENWHNVWFYALGTEYKHNDKWLWRGGVAFDESPITDEDKTARIPGGHRYWITLGGRYQMRDNLSVDFGAAQIFVEDGRVEEAQTGSTPQLDAKYDSQIQIFSLQFNYGF